MADPRDRSRSPSKRDAPSLKPYLAVVALLAVAGVVSFSVMERWLVEPSVDTQVDDVVPGGGRVVVGAKPPPATTSTDRDGSAPSTDEAYKAQEFTFYKSLGASAEAEPKLDPVPAPAPATRPAPAAKAVERPEPAVRKSYTVQVGSFQDRRSAERLATKFRRYQYTVAVTRVVLPDSGVRYRVRVGSFATREDALKVAEVLKKQERVEPFVALIAPSAG